MNNRRPPAAGKPPIKRYREQLPELRKERDVAWAGASAATNAGETKVAKRWRRKARHLERQIEFREDKLREWGYKP